MGCWREGRHNAHDTDEFLPLKPFESTILKLKLKLKKNLNPQLQFIAQRESLLLKKFNHNMGHL